MIGLKVNNYEIKSLVGQGGMGSVYLAEHTVLRRHIAVKVLKREFAGDDTLIARFINEAKAAAAVRQPNIIEVYDVGILPSGLPYLMMEFLEGESLAKRLSRQGRLPLDRALSIARQTALALAAAHAKGVVHRDLKPDNVFLVPDPSAMGGERVKVLDFGIAKLRPELTGEAVRTHTGSLMGTPPYMSPEQCRGISEQIDQRTDIYSLGIMLHEMLAGSPPFVSAGFGDMLMMHLSQAPTPLRRIEATVPPDVEAIVLRALEKVPDKRFASMDAFSTALAATGEPGPHIAVVPSSASDGRVGGSSIVPVTTLTSMAGQMFATAPPPLVPARRTRRLIAGAALAVGVAVVVAGAAMTRRTGTGTGAFAGGGTSSDPKASGEQKESAAAPALPVPAAASPPPSEPSTPAPAVEPEPPESSRTTPPTAVAATAPREKKRGASLAKRRKATPQSASVSTVPAAHPAPAAPGAPPPPPKTRAEKW